MKARSGFLLILALAIVLTLTLSSVALAVPSGGANHNPIGVMQGTYDPADWGGMSKGELQKLYVGMANDGVFAPDMNFGQFLGTYKADEGFKQ
jgi:hypothetical protein